MPSVRKTRKTKSKLAKSSGRKCLRPGPVGRNPYLNFLREFRKNCCGLSAVKTIQQGAKAWNQLKSDERLRYIQEAFYAPKRRRIMRRGVMKRKGVRRMSSKPRVRRMLGLSSRRSTRRMKRSGPKRRSKSRSRSRSSKMEKPVRSKIMCNL